LKKTFLTAKNAKFSQSTQRKDIDILFFADFA